MKTFAVQILFLSFSVGVMVGQNASSLTGSYANYANTIGFKIKPVDQEYHGVVQTADGIFAVRARKANGGLSGKIYAPGGTIDFNASAGAQGLSVSAWGYTEMLYRYSTDHQLAGIDLTPYMVEQPSSGQPAQDFDYGYSQQSNGNAQETYRTYPAQTHATSANSGSVQYPQLYKAIAGGQLVYYTRTSYLTDINASTITYVNFCANGRFNVNYDGSYMVEGNHGGNAQGASYGRHSGTWRVVDQGGVPAIRLAYTSGNISTTPINMTLLQTGRLRVGNTQYAFQHNKVFCR